MSADHERTRWYAEELHRVAELICTVPPAVLWENKKDIGQAIAAITKAMMRAGRQALSNRSDHEGV